MLTMKKFFIRTVAAFGILLLISCDTQVCLLSPAGMGQFFCEPGQPWSLSWSQVSPGNGSSLHYSITDCTGARVVSSSVHAADNGTIEVSVSLPQGFFEITFHETGQRFGIVSLPAQHLPPDPFFSIDAALSTIALPTASRIALLSILKRTGIVCAKDRMDWKALQPSGKRWNWQANNDSEHLRQLYLEYGLRVADLFRNAPAWMCATGKPYPHDLVSAVRSLSGIISRWQKHWAALEAWTEPEWAPQGGNLPADQYSSFIKAAAYACSNSSMAVPLAGGGFAGFCPEWFMKACGDNDLFSHIDVLTFHPYKQADDFEEQVAHIREQLKTYGRQNMPIWFTESILPWDNNAVRPQFDAGARASALDLIAKVVESRACGIERYFPFLLIPYSESGKNYGLIDKHYSPLLMFAAYAQVIRVLSNARYIGDLEVNNPVIRRARVFEIGEQCVVVLYTDEKTNHVVLGPELQYRKIEGIDGRALTFDRRRIPTPDGITYIWADRQGITPLLNTNTRALELYHSGRVKAENRAEPSPVVLQHVFDTDQIQASLEGYRPRAGSAKAFPVCIRVNNFSDTACGISLRITPEDAGIEIDGVRAVDFSVPAFSFKEKTWSCRLTEAGAKKRKRRIVAAADGTGVQWISPLVMDFLTEEE